METLSYDQSQSLDQAMEQVCDDHQPVIVTRPGRRAVVLLSLEDYNALEETAYLLRSPANAERLHAAIDELDAGGGTERELVK